MFEVDQEVVCFLNGEGVVIDAQDSGNYPVIVRFDGERCSYTSKGLIRESHTAPTLYPKGTTFTITEPEVTFEKGEFKELKSLFSQNESEPKNSGILNSAIGEYVIVRSRNEGINAGFLEAADDTGCVLTQARRIWYHKPSNSKLAWYEGVAVSGLHDDSKISCAVDKKYIIEDYSITTCTKEAIKSISGKKSHES